MASLTEFQFISSPYHSVVMLDGYLRTDASGSVINQSSAITAVTDGYTDVYGDAMVLPREVLSVTLDGSTAGLYHLKLKQPWVRVMSVQVTIVGPTIKAGTFQVLEMNAQGADVAGGAKAQTIDLQYQVSGSATAFTSSGFCVKITLMNSKQL